MLKFVVWWIILCYVLGTLWMGNHSLNRVKWVGGVYIYKHRHIPFFILVSWALCCFARYTSTGMKPQGFLWVPTDRTILQLRYVGGSDGLYHFLVFHPPVLLVIWVISLNCFHFFALNYLMVCGTFLNVHFWWLKHSTGWNPQLQMVFW
jgi:hypothetical protein